MFKYPFVSGGSCRLQGTPDNVWRHFWLLQLQRMLLPSSMQRPEMLLRILQWTRQPPPKRNYLIQNVSSAQVDKPCLSQLEFPFWDPETSVMWYKQQTPQISQTHLFQEQSLIQMVLLARSPPQMCLGSHFFFLMLGLQVICSVNSTIPFCCSPFLLELARVIFCCSPSKNSKVCVE